MMALAPFQEIEDSASSLQGQLKKTMAYAELNRNAWISMAGGGQRE